MRDAWTYRSTPDEIKPYPWLSPEAVEYLESIINLGMSVLEFGGGGSTLWFASRVTEVVTVENNDDWADKIKALAPNNVQLCRGISCARPDFDLLLIDGDPVADRAQYLREAWEYVKPGGYVVLDNANRPEYSGARSEFAKAAELLKTFTTPGGKYFVTEFYKWKSS